VNDDDLAFRIMRHPAQRPAAGTGKRIGVGGSRSKERASGGRRSRCRMTITPAARRNGLLCDHGLKR
jgi:hypothetical protein